MSIYPITQSSLACLAPHQTPSLTGPVTSVSCQMGSHVTSVDWMTCRSSNSPTQPTLLLEVYRYCSTTLYWHFRNFYFFIFLLFLPLITIKSPGPGQWRIATKGHSRRLWLWMLQLGQPKFRVQRYYSAVIFSKSGKDTHCISIFWQMAEVSGRKKQVFKKSVCLQHVYKIFSTLATVRSNRLAI